MLMFAKRPLFALSALLLIGACDDDDDSQSMGSDAAADGGITHDAATGTDGGAGGTGGGGGSSGSTLYRTGSVSVVNTSITIGTTTVGSYVASASFAETTASETTANTNCTTKKEGSCTISVCPKPVMQPRPPATQPAAPKLADVGKIDITGGAEAIALVPDATSTYAPAQGMTSLWSGPTKLRFSAAGGTLAAFAPTELDVPVSITDVKLGGMAPPAFGMAATVAKAGPIALAWQGGTGDVSVTLSQDGTDKLVSALCLVPASAASFTAPAALLTELAPGSAVMLLGQATHKQVTAGGYDVALTASASPNPALIQLQVQ